MMYLIKYILETSIFIYHTIKSVETISYYNLELFKSCQLKVETNLHGIPAKLDLCVGITKWKILILSNIFRLQFVFYFFQIGVQYKRVTMFYLQISLTKITFTWINYLSLPFVFRPTTWGALFVFSAFIFGLSSVILNNEIIF